MSAIKRLRGLADDIDWHIYNNGGIPRELRSIADEIEAEDDKLRKRVGELEELTDGKLYIPQEWYAQLKTEDAKLRELVADVHDALRADKTGMFHKLILASMEDDMRELGVEVDE